MAKTLRNLSTDTTLGGNAPSDYIAPSQKAVKTALDTKADSSALSGKQDRSNLVTSVSASSTDAQYPSAKLFYTTCGNIESLINAL